MSPWNPRRFPEYAPKQPAPSQGIKVKNAGSTWWGQHWVQALERVLAGDSGRLARGRSYARAGRTHDFVVAGGKVEAKVTGSRAPYRVSVALGQLSDATWDAAIAVMAQKAEFAALLLNREMPRDIDEAFQPAGESLFPRTRRDLSTECDCPDHGDPCKHIAAVHYVIGDALDRDPFLLFELRGRSGEQVLGALAEARGRRSPSGAPRRQSRSAADATANPPSVALEPLSAQAYEAAPAPLPALSFSFQPPPVHAAVLRQLGAPGGWNRDSPPVETLTPIVRAAAEAARRLALIDAPEQPSGPAATEPAKRRTKKARPSSR